MLMRIMQPKIINSHICVLLVPRHVEKIKKHKKINNLVKTEILSQAEGAKNHKKRKSS